MVPPWLSAPPIGLTDAERRVLEGFFVAEDVKATAELLVLSPKTVQNELLLARQTMGESKSWMAAIRYVFHVKRQGHGFLEAQLVPKIERQIRRLIDDYMEAMEEERTDVPVVAKGEVVPSWVLEPETTELGSNEIVAVETAHENVAADEHFERQLLGLTRVAALVYEQPSRVKKKRAGLTLVLACLAAAIGWGYYSTVSTGSISNQVLAVVDNDIRAGLQRLHDSNTANSREGAQLADRACTRYWEEMWGPGERSLVDDVFKKYRLEIQAGASWALDNDKGLALRIYGNGHRAFDRAKEKPETWYPQLLEVVTANKGDKSLYMVRALCGVIFGSLNSGRVAGGYKSQREFDADRETAATQLEQLLPLIRDPYDKANATRHLAMTQSVRDGTSRRIATCKKALSIYEGLPGERAKRGVAQCALSIAQSGGSPILHQQRNLDAYALIRASCNEYVVRECVEEMNNCVATALQEQPQQPQHAAVMGRVRQILFDYAKESGVDHDSAAQQKLLRDCLAIDAKYSPVHVAEDIQEVLAADRLGEISDEASYLLAGYVNARLKVRNLPIRGIIKDRLLQKDGANAVKKGATMTDAEAVALIPGVELQKANSSRPGH